MYNSSRNRVSGVVHLSENGRAVPVRLPSRCFRIKETAEPVIVTTSARGKTISRVAQSLQPQHTFTERGVHDEWGRQVGCGSSGGLLDGATQIR